MALKTKSKLVKMKVLSMISWLFILSGTAMLGIAASGFFGMKIPSGGGIPPNFFKNKTEALQSPVKELAELADFIKH